MVSKHLCQTLVSDTYRLTNRRLLPRLLGHAAPTQEARCPSGRPRSPRAEDPEPHPAAWIRHRGAHSADLRRCPKGRRRVAVSGTPPHGVGRVDHRRVADHCKQPAREALSAHPHRREAPRRRAREVGSPHPGGWQSAPVCVGGFMGWRRRLRGTILKSSIDEELAEEIRFHIEERTDEYVRGGMSVEEARREAQRRLGNLTMTKDQTRDADTLRWLDEFFQDLRYAGRLLQRNPLFALTAALSLAIGIGANTTIFTIANALLFRAPAGVVEPDRLVDIGVSRNGYGFNPGSYPNYVDLRQRATTLEDVYAHPLFPAPMSLDGPTGASGAERVFATAVTRNYFTVLGAQPAVGRLFDPQARARPEAAAAGQADEDAIVVLSHNCWTRRFNRDPQIVGQTLRLNGKPFLIVGVAREGFKGTGIRAGDVWMPLATRASGPAEGGSSLTNRAPGWLMVGGRLKPGVSVSQAAAEIDAIGRALEHDHPVDNRGKQLRLLASSAVPGSTEPIIGFLALLMGIVTTVLAIACANLAGVLLARAAARRREIAVRLAIGAGRWRLIRQMLVETSLLFVIGAAAGLALARVMTTLLVSM